MSELREQEKRKECLVARLVIIVGPSNDNSLRGAEEWAARRAADMGGNTYLWRSYSNSNPMEKIRAADISGDDINSLGRFHESPNRRQNGFDDVLPDFHNCKGRIEELVIFHHGRPVDEEEVADQIGDIFELIRVPVCRIVWWACNAEVALDVRLGHWTDSFMKRMGGLAFCKPCGCENPIELIWPTSGKCYIDFDGEDELIQTNDGNVNRMRWGYRWGGELHVNPDPSESHHSRNPPDREPSDDGAEGPGSVFGQPVTRKP